MVLAATAVGACAPASTDEGPSASEEAALVSLTRLDRVTPAEVAKLYAADLAPHVAACAAAHPQITDIDAGNLDTFYRAGTDWHWDVREAVRGMLAQNGGRPVPVATLASAVEPYATARLSEHVDGDGFYVAPRDGALDFYYAELRAREAKALSLARDPAGLSIADAREKWRAVEHARSNLDSAWLNPVKVGASPGIGDIRKAMGIGRSVAYVACCYDAVDQFGEADEGPDGARAYIPLAQMLKSQAIKKRWFFAGRDSGRGDGWSRHYLVVLDKNDQLWGVMMGYSE